MVDATENDYSELLHYGCIYQPKDILFPADTEDDIPLFFFPTGFFFMHFGDRFI